MKIKNIFFVVCLISVLISCGGAEERKAAYLEKAKHSMEIGDLSKARIELKNVLQIDPKDARAHFLLGNVYEEKKDYTKAFSRYNKASELDPANSEYNAKIGHFYLSLAGDIEKAKERKDIILNTKPEDVHGLILDASILRKQGKVKEAKELAQNIFSKHPENVLNSILLSSIYVIDNDYDNAVTVLNACIEHNNDNEKLTSLLMNVYFAAKEYDEAENVLKNVLAKHPDIFNNYLKLAIFYQKTERNDDAEAILRKAINQDPEDAKRQVFLIEYTEEFEGVLAAIDEAKALIKISPDIGELKVALGKLYIKNNNLNEAKSVFESAISSFSEDKIGVDSRVFLASIHIKEDNVDKAASIIDEAIQVSPNDPAVNLLKAKIALSKKDFESAIIALRIVTKNQPESIEAYLLLASVYKAQGENVQASDVTNLAYENNRTNTDVLLALAKYHKGNNNAEIAEKIINDYLRIDSNNYEALSIKLGFLANKKQYDESKQLIEIMLSNYPEKENGYLYSAIPYMEDKSGYDKALQILENGYTKTNQGMKILVALTKLQVSMKNYDAAIARIKDKIGKNDDAELFMAISDVYLSSGDYDEAEKYLNRVIKIKPDSNRAYILVSQIHEKRGNNDRAMNILEEGLSNIDNDYMISLSLARLHEVNKDYDNAINLYETLLENNADKVILINNLAALLSEHRVDAKSLDRAKELADKLKDINQSAIQDTVGWVYYKTGNYMDAVSTLESVVINSPDNPVFNYHLGMAYLKTGNKDLAKKHLAQALEQKTDFPGREDADRSLKSL